MILSYSDSHGYEQIRKKRSLMTNKKEKKKCNVERNQTVQPDACVMAIGRDNNSGAARRHTYLCSKVMEFSIMQFFVES
jgi:hypothetical protein